MRYALSLNVAEHRQVDTMESRVNKVTRNVQWQIDLKVNFNTFYLCSSGLI